MKSLLRFFLILIIIIAVALTAMVVYTADLNRPPEASSTEAIFRVEKGDSARQYRQKA